MNNENKANINWYPGHMAKTKREIKERINLIDLIYEVIDARMPLSSKMKGMDEIIKDKPCILVMTKKDLCDIEETNKWVLEYEKLGYKMREAQTKKIPYILVVGDKELEGNTVNYRKHGSKESVSISVDDFIQMIKEQINNYK